MQPYPVPTIKLLQVILTSLEISKILDDRIQTQNHHVNEIYGATVIVGYRLR